MSETFETLLGHTFQRPDLLREALTHRSALRARARGKGSNERLEFIGDRVLGLLMAEWLAERFPAEQEGELGRTDRPAQGCQDHPAGMGAPPGLRPARLCGHRSLWPAACTGV